MTNIQYIKRMFGVLGPPKKRKGSIDLNLTSHYYKINNKNLIIVTTILELLQNTHIFSI